MLPKIVLRKMEALIVAKIYNSRTSASITHYDVEEWGFVESMQIISALEFMDEL